MKLTLKDLFARAAMQGLLSNPECSLDVETLAKQAYVIAFAMWEERERLKIDHTFDDSSLDLDDS